MKPNWHLRLIGSLGLLLVLVGCNLPSGTPEGSSPPPVGLSNPALTATAIQVPAQTVTSTVLWTSTPAASYTPWPITSLPSATPSITLTPTITPSPTFDFPRVTAIMQANCRYGPGTAYLYAHGMYPGDGGTVWGRNYSGTWLWIQPDNIAYQCWISTAVVEVQGDIFSVYVAQVRLPHSTLYSAPEDVMAIRDGDSVTVTWSRVPMTEDDFRGYLLEVTVCQNGSPQWMAVHTDELSYVFTDETGCESDSGGQLYAVEKHGYTDPVVIPWP